MEEIESKIPDNILLNGETKQEDVLECLNMFMAQLWGESTERPVTEVPAEDPLYSQPEVPEKPLYTQTEVPEKPLYTKSKVYLELERIKWDCQIAKE